jgi:hypothetical protein
MARFAEASGVEIEAGSSQPPTGSPANNQTETSPSIADRGQMNSSSATQRQRPPAAQEERPHTRLRDGIRKPRVYTDGTIRYGMIASTGEHSNLTEALTYSN